MMFVQALGSGTVGIAVDSGVSYTAAFQTLAVGVGVLVTGLYAIYRAGWLPDGDTPGETPAVTETSR
jgi:hypothetical protein